MERVRRKDEEGGKREGVRRGDTARGMSVGVCEGGGGGREERESKAEKARLVNGFSMCVIR